MNLGVCYYPEQWPPERWAIDAKLMRQAGLSLVRIADFAWSAMEPSQGGFNWGWLDKAIELLAAEDLQILLCTPTASPPPWLCRAHPDILPVDGWGRRRRAGSRRHYCPNSDTYRRHTARIVTELASRYGNHAAVVGWQIDNEFGCHYSARCYCDSCAAAFRVWLEEKYGTIDRLNQAWGTIFWSQTYGDWSEIDLPNLTVAEPNPSHMLDHYRFCSDSFVIYQQLQLSILRSMISVNQLVTTNFMNRFTDLDYQELAKPLDLVTSSSYPTGHAESEPSLYLPSSIRPDFPYDVGDPYITGFGHTLMRGFKPGHPYWVMEQQCGNVNWSSYNCGVRPGTMRLWTWHAVASGAEAVIYFRWRAGLFAQEQMHSGLLHHDASPAVGYADLKTMERDRILMSEVASTPHRAQIAFLLDYDALWAVQLQPHNRDFGYLRLLFVYYRALQRLGLAADIVSNDADLGQYKLLIAPTAFLPGENMAPTLKAFADAGGTIMLGVRSGFKTIDNQVTNQPLPGPFRELVGVTVSGWHSLPPGIGYGLESTIPGLAGQASVWVEALEPVSLGADSPFPEARMLASYVSGPFTSSNALSEYRVGAGRALYLGWFPDDSQAEALLAHLAAQATVCSPVTPPDGLIVCQRGSFLVLLNFTDEPLTATVQGEPVSVAPREVEVVKTT